MIQIKNIVKKYLTGDNEVTALKDVSLNFRNNEFVSILGPSGCGKTTLLNIIGGLDQYTSGDLLINNISTKEYKDRDWDSYRNHSVGFVFQSYNLISHQSVLQNVELALTLSGVSKTERRARAIEALEEVGLGDQIHKKPNAMSGGQMQRVAIARALVNNPDIILADEPTGALDTETSVQVMEILKKVSKDRLVVMVTHNPELAEKYSTRIIKMLDGKILDDSRPYAEENFKRAEKKEIKKEEAELEILSEKVKKKRTKKPTMSFWTAFKLSLKNLFTKKGRTMLTSFAGSIGIIGIALILAVSQGTTGYIDYVQETTLSSYPLTIEESTIDLTSLMTSFMNVGSSKDVTHELDAIYKDQVIAEMVEALSKVETSENDLTSFKNYLEEEIKKEDSELKDAISGIQYSYDLELSIYTKNQNGNIIKSDTSELMTDMLGKFMIKSMNPGETSSSTTTTPTEGNSMSSMMSSRMFGLNLWQEILPGLTETEIINNSIYEQYELINGSWPNDYNEVVLIVNENNELDDLTLYALGLLSEEDIDAIIDAAVNGQTLPEDNTNWSYEEIKNLTFKTILPSDCYEKLGDIYIDKTNSGSMLDNTFFENLYNNGLELKIKGIIRPKKDADASLLSSGIGYTSQLTEHIIEKAKESAVVKAQIASPSVNVLTGEPFKSSTGSLSNAQKNEAFREYVSDLNTSSKANTFIAVECLIPQTQLNASAKNMMDTQYTTRESQLALITQVISATMEDVDGAALEGYFAEMSHEQVYALAFGICQGFVQEGHSSQVKGQYLALDSNDERIYSDADLAALLDQKLLTASESDCAWYYDNVTKFSEKTYEEVLKDLGCLDIDSPSAINIYATSFENKDIIVDAIDKYNKNVDDTKKISYTDYIGLLMSSITTIINAITYVLIAFVSISLIVSSIMIGVITLISVQERTKEIGILRAIGASKRDVSSMFNAETLIIGFTSGLTGVVITYLLCIPINLILKALTGLAHLKAVLPIGAALILVLISMVLTLVAGLIPSRSAAKKDPVIALRSE